MPSISSASLCDRSPKPGPFRSRHPTSGYHSVVERRSSPRFLVNPFRICPVLRPRPGRPLRPLRAFSAVPSITTKKTPAIVPPFEAHSHGFCGHCLRFALRSPSCARLASDFLSGFIGWAFHPQGCSREFQMLSILPPLQIYPGAMLSVVPFPPLADSSYFGYYFFLD